MSNAKVNFDMPTGIANVANVGTAVLLTSHLYPVEVFEGYTVHGLVGSYQILDPPDDGYEVTATVTALELRPVTGNYETDPEAYSVAATVQSVELRPLLLNYEIDPEAYSVVATVPALELKRVLVQNEMAPEGYGVSATVTGLELS